jgi:hypothetical protein
MIVDQLDLTDADGERERSARIRWTEGALRVRITAPGGAGG